MKAPAFFLPSVLMSAISNATAPKNTNMAMTVRITAENPVAKSTLTNRPIVGIMAFVRKTVTSAASFQADLTAAVTSVGPNPAQSAPLLVHGVIRSSGISRKYWNLIFSCILKLEIWELIIVDSGYPNK